jgi:hypothetical protein
MAAPNLINSSAIYGKTAVQAVTTSATAIVTNSAASGKVLKVNALYVANVDGTSNAEITADVFRSSTAYRIASTMVVPADGAVSLLDQPIYLEEGDSLRLTANANSDLEAVCSYEDIS